MSLLQVDYEALIAETIVTEMIRAAQAANLPQNFIDGITLTKTGNTQWKIDNGWRGDNDEPLAIWFEHGTRRHWVEPKNAKVLAWQSEGPESGHAQAIYSKRHDNYKGQWLYSKGHYVTGLPATEAMHNGFKIGMARMRERLARGT